MTAAYREVTTFRDTEKWYVPLPPSSRCPKDADSNLAESREARRFPRSCLEILAWDFGEPWRTVLSGRKFYNSDAVENTQAEPNEGFSISAKSAVNL